jgi:hypothetical protein
MSNCITPPRVNRVDICPPAPKRNQNRRPSFFEPVILFPEDSNEIQSKIDMVKNFLNYFPSGTFKHTSEISDVIITELSCKCERISFDTCVYSKI